MHQHTGRSQFRSTSCLTVGSGVHVFVIKPDHNCADKAIIALPLTAVSGAPVFVAECDTAKFLLSTQTLVNPLLNDRVNGVSQRSPRCISVNTRSLVGPQWFLDESLPFCT